MKMMYNGTQIKSLNIKHYEMDTNSATVQPSDLQAGVTCFGRGKKITGTGKSFEFAYYGQMETNYARILPNNEVNIVQISSIEYPVKLNVTLSNMKNSDFITGQTVGNIVIDSTEHPLVVTVNNNRLTVVCDQTIPLEIFYGKDNYV